MASQVHPSLTVPPLRCSQSPFTWQFKLWLRNGPIQSDHFEGFLVSHQGNKPLWMVNISEIWVTRRDHSWAIVHDFPSSQSPKAPKFHKTQVYLALKSVLSYCINTQPRPSIYTRLYVYTWCFTHVYPICLVFWPFFEGYLEALGISFYITKIIWLVVWNIFCFSILQEEQSLCFLKAWQSIHLGQPRITFPSPFRVAGVGRSIITCF